jgi:Domain of unknown function (DUF2382)
MNSDTSQSPDQGNLLQVATEISDMTTSSSKLETAEIREEQLISLLEERLSINRKKRKVGEVVVRKQIETRIVPVSVRWEKLIVEQIGDETKQLTEINLGQGEITGIEIKDLSVSDRGYVVSGEFFSLKAASDILAAIALQAKTGCNKVQIQLVVEDSQTKEICQNMFDRSASKQ